MISYGIFPTLYETLSDPMSLLVFLGGLIGVYFLAKKYGARTPLPRWIQYATYGVLALIIAFAIVTIWYASTATFYFNQVIDTEQSQGMSESYIR